MQKNSESISREQKNHPRIYESNQFVYPVLSRRSGGVSIGVNLNPDKNCNFDCPYCQVDRSLPGPTLNPDPFSILEELQNIFQFCNQEGSLQIEKFSDIPDANKRVKDIALSGDGEPTMLLNFENICKALHDFQDPVYKLVLITNATGFHQKRVQAGIDWLMKKNGAIWAKLDAGTEKWFQTVNVSKTPLKKIVQNIKDLGQNYPLTIQSMFLKYEGKLPDKNEVAEYINKLRQIKMAGTKIEEVQLYTVARKPSDPNCSPAELPFLQKVQKDITELKIPVQIYGVSE